MKAEILVLAEHDDGRLDPATADLISWGEALATAKQCRLMALLLGHRLDSAVKALSDLGVARILVGDDQQLADYNPSLYRYLSMNCSANIHRASFLRHIPTSALKWQRLSARNGVLR